MSAQGLDLNYRPQIPPEMERGELYKVARHMAKYLKCETFPVVGKDPAPVEGMLFTWKKSAFGKPGVHECSIHAWKHATGYAVHPCDNLVIVEYDDPATGAALLDVLPVLERTFTVQRGERKHWYVRTAELMVPGLRSLRRDKHELASIRGRDAYVVGAGSTHPSGDKYVVMRSDNGVIQLSPEETRALFLFFDPPTAPENTPRRPGRPAAPAAARATAGTSPDSEINPDLLQAIILGLEVHEGRALVFSDRGTASLYRNPMRGADDRNRSAYFSRVTGWIHDRATGESWNTAKVCDFLNIRINALGGLYRRDEPAPAAAAAPAAMPTPRPTATPPEPPANLRAATWWPSGIPDKLREVFLNIDNASPDLADQTPALMTYEIYNAGVRQGLIEPRERVTVRLLGETSEALGWHTSRWTVEKGLYQLVAFGVVRELGDDLEGYEGGNPVLSNAQQKPGRPARVYRFRKIKAAILAMLQQMRLRLREFIFGGGNRPVVPDEPSPAWFGGDGLAAWKAAQVKARDVARMQAADLAAREKAQRRYEKALAERENVLHLESLLKAESTPLPTDRPYENASQYRDNLLLGKVRAHPDRQISREKAARELGLSASTLSAAAARAGVERVPTYEIFELVPGAAILEQVRRCAFWALKHPGAAIVATDANTTPEDPVAGTYLDAPDVDEWARVQFGHGLRVWLRVQVASREREAGAPTPPPPPATASKPSGPRAERRERRLTIWRSYNPDFVARQLALRGLADHAEGLVDVETGEIYSPPPRAA